MSRDQAEQYDDRCGPRLPRFRGAASARLAALVLVLIHAGCSARQSSSCLEPGRRDECALTLEFDARTEQFTRIEARGFGNAKAEDKALPWNDARPFPVLTGDVLNVRILNATYGEIITAEASSVARTPFPRPDIRSDLSFASVVFQNLASPKVEPRPTKPQGLDGISPRGLLNNPRTFMASWTSQVRKPLAEHASVKAEAVRLDSAVMRLNRQSKLISMARDEILGKLTLLQSSVTTAAASIGGSCELGSPATTISSAEGSPKHGPSLREGSKPDAITEGDCLSALYKASSLQARQEGLHRVIEQLLSSIDVASAQATIAEIEQGFARPAIKNIMAINLDVAEEMAEPSDTLYGPSDEPRPSIASVRQSLTRSSALKSIPNIEAILKERNPTGLALLVDQIRTMRADYVALKTYRATREMLIDRHDSVPRISRVIEDFRDQFDQAYMDLALAMTNLAFVFDHASAKQMKAVTVPVFRSTTDETITVKLVRIARFGPAPELAIKPGKPANGDADTKAAGNSNGNGNGDSAQPAAREYKFELVGRSKQYFQVAAGFLFSGVRSSTFSTRDETTAVGTGTERKDSTRRYITETEQRAPNLAPAALLVYHIFGKDVHPDAYRSARVLIPGIAIGTTLTNPIDNFTAGPTWEFVPGLHVSVGWHTTHVQKLQEGFSLGSEIPTTASAPTRNARESGWYAAGMLDSGVFANFFGKLFTGK